MKKTGIRKCLSLILCMVLAAAMALFTNGCSNSNSAAPAQTAAEAPADESVLGEGKTQFTFTVTDGDGNESSYEIHTDKTTVGEALLDLGLIAGEESEYGLYVKTVNGITADYDKDGVYWAFYVDGEYASAGVDATDIQEGSVYSFKVE